MVCPHRRRHDGAGAPPTLRRANLGRAARGHRDIVDEALPRLNAPSTRASACRQLSPGWDHCCSRAAMRWPRCRPGWTSSTCSVPRPAATRRRARRRRHGTPSSTGGSKSSGAARGARRSAGTAAAGAAARIARHRPASTAERKRAQRVIAFDDMLANLHQRLAGPGGSTLAAALRQRFPAALIDEFQDTDPMQFAIFDAHLRRRRRAAVPGRRPEAGDLQLPQRRPAHLPARARQRPITAAR